MASELALALQRRIGEAHKRCVDLSKKLEQIMMDQLQATRETGVLLKAARDDLSPNEFDELRAAVGMDSEAVRNYVSFASQHSEPVTRLDEALGCMKTVLRTTGLLEFAPIGGKRAPVGQFWAYASRAVRNLIAAWQQFTAGRELSQDEKDQALAIFRPLLAITKSLL
jgi:hypothetical protein